MADSDTIHIESGVSAFTGAGFVTIRWGGESGQLTPDEARMHALHVLECAEAAESDAAVFALLHKRIGMPAADVGAIITDLREHRGRPAGGV